MPDVSSSAPIPPPSGDKWAKTGAAQKNTDTSAVQSKTTQQAANQAEAGKALVLVFEALLSSLVTTSSLAMTQGKRVKANADDQMNLNQGMNRMQNIVVPTSATSAELKQVEQLNANITIQRQNTQGIVLSLRQSGQQLSTQAQVYVNYLQQTGSEMTGVLRVLITVFKLINRISPSASQGN